ncbi:MAG: TRAP transporter small permease [Alphaproteobacteria bacterium]|nr:TRAP transporter small permease [Alphaproteobacteria bacterium]
MRRILARLYSFCGGLAAVFLVGVCLCSLYSIGGGLFGYVARSADDFAGFSMAASSFLALAYAFGHGEHIRVTLFLDRVTGAPRRWLELWCLAAGGFLSGYFAYYSVKSTYVSWQLNDVSQGLIPVPLWFPQSAMALGTTVLFVAIAEKLVDVARGGALVRATDAEDAHIER